MYVFYINSHIGVRISPGDLAEIMFISTALLFFPCTIVSMTALHGVYTIFKEDVDSKIRNNSLFVLIPCIVAPIGVFITVVRHVTI